MYLAVILVDVQPDPADTSGLQRAFEATRTESDHIEHICLERSGQRMVVALYLLGADPDTAGRAAEQLCRRALVGWRACHTWVIRSCEVRLVGSVQPTRRPGRR